jgi:hypothetical protein
MDRQQSRKEGTTRLPAAHHQTTLNVSSHTVKNYFMPTQQSPQNASCSMEKKNP